MLPYIGGNQLFGLPPKGFENLLTLWVDVKTPEGYQGEYNTLLIPDQNWQIPVAGRLVFRGSGSTYRSFEFKHASILEKPNQPIRLRFTTQNTDGVSYIFEGHYPDPLTHSSTGKVSLEGVMRKLKGGRVTSKQFLRFKPFVILE